MSPISAGKEEPSSGEKATEEAASPSPDTTTDSVTEGRPAEKEVPTPGSEGETPKKPEAAGTTPETEENSEFSAEHEIRSCV